jgi:hypothetical protein
MEMTKRKTTTAFERHVTIKSAGQSSAAEKALLEFRKIHPGSNAHRIIPFYNPLDATILILPLA